MPYPKNMIHCRHDTAFPLYATSHWHAFVKKQAPQEHTLQECAALKEKHASYAEFYTGRSKTAVHIGRAVVQGIWEKAARLPGFASIFTAESYAVCLAVRKIVNEYTKKTIIHTDFLSLLTVLHSRNAVGPLVGSSTHNIEKVSTRARDTILLGPSAASA